MSRALSELEQVIWHIDQTVNQNWVLTTRLLKPIEEPVLRQALDIVQNRHPLFHCKMRDGSPPEFITEGVPQIPLKVIPMEGEEHWMEVADKELLEPLPWREGPLLRVTLITSETRCDLLLTVCHIIADGMSSIILVNNLLRVVEKLSRGETQIDEPDRPELLSSLDLIKDHSLGEKMKKWWHRTFDGIRVLKWINKPVGLSGEKEDTPIKRKSHLIPRFLSKEETKKMISRCKQEKTTVHGAVCAALLQTIAADIRKSKGVSPSGPLMLGCLSPINIRLQFKEPMGEDIGNFISDASHFQRVDETISLWEVAKRTKKSLEKELKTVRDIDALKSIGSLLTRYKTPLEMVKSMCQFFPPVIVTNIGRFMVPEKFGEFTIEGFHYTASITPAARDGFGLVAFTFNGRMTLDFIYAEPFITREKAEVLIDGTLKRLRDAIS